MKVTFKQRLKQLSRGALKKELMKAHISPIVKQIWLVCFTICLYHFAIQKHKILPLGLMRAKPSNPSAKELHYLLGSSRTQDMKYLLLATNQVKEEIEFPIVD